MNETYNPEDPAVIADHEAAIVMDSNLGALAKMKRAAELKREALHLDEAAFADVGIKPTEATARAEIAVPEIKWPFTPEEVTKLEQYPKEYKEFLTAMLKIQQELSTVFGPLEKKSKQWLSEHPNFDRSREGDPKNVLPEVLLEYSYPYIFLKRLGELTEEWRPDQFENKLEKKKVKLEANEHEKFAKYWWQNLRVEIFSDLFAAEQIVSAYVKTLYPDSPEVENAVKALNNSVKIAREFFEKQGVIFDASVPVGTEIDLNKVERVDQGIIKAPDTELELKIDNQSFNPLLVQTKLFASQIREKGRSLVPGKTFVYQTDIGYIGPEKARYKLTQAWLYDDRFKQAAALA